MWVRSSVSELGLSRNWHHGTQRERHFMQVTGNKNIGIWEAWWVWCQISWSKDFDFVRQWLRWDLLLEHLQFFFVAKLTRYSSSSTSACRSSRSSASFCKVPLPESHAFCVLTFLLATQRFSLVHMILSCGLWWQSGVSTASLEWFAKSTATFTWSLASCQLRPAQSSTSKRPIYSFYP